MAELSYMRRILTRNEILTKFRSILSAGRHQELEALSDAFLGEMAALLPHTADGGNHDRRSEPRRAVISRVEVIASPGNEQPIRQEGFQEDRSSKGASVVVSSPIAVGTRVRVVRGLRNTQEGTVRNCRRGNSGWILGIEYDHSK
jgi:hypothetical protein